MISKRIVRIIDAIVKISMLWVAAFPAFFWSCAPTYLLIRLVAPTPSPTLTPFKIMNMGVTNPTPAIAVSPSPVIHIPSTNMYKLVSIIDNIIGHARCLIAFSGSPLNNFMFSCDIIFALSFSTKIV